MKTISRADKLDALKADMDAAAEVWRKDYRRLGLGTSNAHRASVADRLKNNGLWVRFKNRQRKYEAALQ